MKIVDARTHIGRSKNTSSRIPGDDIIAKMDQHGIDAAIVQPLPSASDVNDYEEEHMLVMDLARRYPKRIFGLICLPPQIGRERYVEAAKRYLDMGFVGLKYHPLFHGGSLLSTNARMVYEIGAELGTSVSAHTGPGIPWTSPSLMIPIAQQYPETTFVLVHAGGWLGADEAGVAASQCSNLLLDSSWHYPITVMKFIKEVGHERIMMASDFPDNLGMQRMLWDSVGLTDEQKSISLGGLAIKVFGLEGRL